MLEMILARDGKNGGIGTNGKLPWYLPSDLLRFKMITSHANVFMGSNTFKSIGRALPNRHNFVITRDEAVLRKWCADNDVDCSKVKFLEFENDEQIESFFDVVRTRATKNIVLGGAYIYKLALPYVDQIHLTNVRIRADVPPPEYDTFYNDPFNGFRVITYESTKDTKDEHLMEFTTLVREPVQPSTQSNLHVNQLEP